MELTFNYNLECLGNGKTACKCGAPNCSGFLGVRPKVEYSVRLVKALVTGHAFLCLALTKFETKMCCLVNVLLLIVAQSQTQTEKPKEGKRKVPIKKKTKQQVTKEREDECFSCGDGGQIVSCKKPGCPKVYHADCLNLAKRPAGQWRYRGETVSAPRTAHTVSQEQSESAQLHQCWTKKKDFDMDQN